MSVVRRGGFAKEGCAKSKGRARDWVANYYHHVTAAMRDQVRADQAASEAEQQRLAAQRDAAQGRWQQLARVAEAARTHLGLPAIDARRG